MHVSCAVLQEERKQEKSKTVMRRLLVTSSHNSNLEALLVQRHCKQQAAVSPSPVRQFINNEYKHSTLGAYVLRNNTNRRTANQRMHATAVVCYGRLYHRRRPLYMLCYPPYMLVLAEAARPAWHSGPSPVSKFKP